MGESLKLVLPIWWPRECAGRNASERRASLEKVDVQADPTAESGKAATAGGDERGLRPAAAPGDWGQHVHKETQGRSWGGRRDVGGLRGRTRAAARRPAQTGPSGSVPAAALPADVYTEGGWEAAATGDCRPGGQDRPGCYGHGAQCHLRGRIPRVLVRVPARTRTTRRARRSGRGDHQTEGELGS